MRAPGVLFRVLIALSLVLNGTGSAFASTQMLLAADGQVDQAMPSAATGHMGHAGHATSPPCHDEQAPRSPADDGQEKNPHADCCQSGACSCPCAAHASAALVGVAPATACLAHAVDVRPMALGHPTPALPHLIRPPIG